MKALFDKNPALLLIDIQYGLDDPDFYGGNRNNPDAEKNMDALLQKWRIENRPIFHVRHSSTNPESPLHPSKPGFEMKDPLKPIEGEPLYTKNVNSAFIGTTLEKDLKDQGIDTVVIVGLTTNHCISTSVRMAGNLGFETYLIGDATATFDRIGVDGKKYDSEVVHQTALASLHEEFAQVVNTQDLLL
ncbi:MAG: cysteine hydrolase family protein [Bacteroidota bacterium]